MVTKIGHSLNSIQTFFKKFCKISVVFAFFVHFGSGIDVNRLNAKTEVMNIKSSADFCMIGSSMKKFKSQQFIRIGNLNLNFNGENGASN